MQENTPCPKSPEKLNTTKSKRCRLGKTLDIVVILHLKLKLEMSFLKCRLVWMVVHFYLEYNIFKFNCKV